MVRAKESEERTWKQMYVQQNLTYLKLESSLQPVERAKIQRQRKLRTKFGNQAG